MSKIIALVFRLLILLAMETVLANCGQQPSEWTNVQLSSFFSSSRDQMIEFAIYTPPDYESGNQHYPVLYVLHGSGSDYTMYWAQISEAIPEANGDAGAWLNQLIIAETIPPIIINVF